MKQFLAIPFLLSVATAMVIKTTVDIIDDTLDKTPNLPKHYESYSEDTLKSYTAYTDDHSFNTNNQDQIFHALWTTNIYGTTDCSIPTIYTYTDRLGCNLGAAPFISASITGVTPRICFYTDTECTGRMNQTPLGVTACYHPGPTMRSFRQLRADEKAC